MEGQGQLKQWIATLKEEMLYAKTIYRDQGNGSRMEMKGIAISILTAFFLLELGAMAAFSYWGYHLDAGSAVKIILAVAAPLAIATLWGLFLSPKASLPIFNFPVRTALKLGVFIAASGALYAAGRNTLAVAFLTVSFLIVATVFILKLHEAKL